MLLAELNEINAAAARDPEGNTALHIAAARGNLRAVKVLMVYSSTSNASAIDVTNNRGELAVHKAAHYENIDIVQYLLLCGCVLNHKFVTTFISPYTRQYRQYQQQLIHAHQQAVQQLQHCKSEERGVREKSSKNVVADYQLQCERHVRHSQQRPSPSSSATMSQHPTYYLSRELTRLSLSARGSQQDQRQLNSTSTTDPLDILGRIPQTVIDCKQQRYTMVMSTLEESLPSTLPVQIALMIAQYDDLR